MRARAKGQVPIPGAEGAPRPGRWAADLPDDHHSTVLRAPDEASARPLTSLDGYLARVDELKRRDAMFEKIEIETNLGCNRRCAYCFLATRDRREVALAKQKIMSWQLYEALLEQLHDVDFAGVICFHFYAEPLLNARLHLFIRAAKERLPRSRGVLYSNGDHLDADRFDQLMGAGLDVVYVTLHDDLLPEALLPLLERPGLVVDSRRDMTLNNRGGSLGPALDPRVRSLPCIFTAETVVVTIDGNVLPCSCDFDESMSFGNIRAAHIRDIYRSERAREFRRALLAGERARYDLCRDCDYYAEVLGVPSAAEPLRYQPQADLVQIRRRKGERAPG